MTKKTLKQLLLLLLTLVAVLCLAFAVTACGAINNGGSNGGSGSNEDDSGSNEHIHTWNSGEVTQEATCTEDGVLTYTCTSCSETKTEKIFATGHTEAEAVTENEVAATCTADGAYDMVVYCSVCGAEISRDPVTVDSSGHTWNEGEVTTAATCTEKGVFTYTCTSCGETKTKKLAATGHTWNEGEVTTAANCTEDGVFTYTCISCGETKIESIERIAHTYGDYLSDENSHWRVCTACDTKTEKQEHTYNTENVCAICGYEKLIDSDGLEYTLSEDETYYAVSGIGTCTDTKIVIPSVYNNLPVKSIESFAFRYCTSFTSINIGNSVDTIGVEAFWNCSSLKSVTIGSGVTSIGRGAFYNTAFYSDSKNWNNNVLYIGIYLISAKPSVSGSYEIKEGTTVIAEEAFNECSLLTSIIIPDSVITIDNLAFAHCSSLESVTIPNNVTKIGNSAFNDCILLSNINIPDNVTTIGNGAFYNCASLTSVVIGNAVTTIGYTAFTSCTLLTSITIGNAVTFIGNYAFSGCTSLISVTIGNCVTNIDSYAFYDCTSLESVYYGGSASQWASILFGDYYANPVFYASNLYLNDTLVTDITLEGITTINAYAFIYCASLTNITISDSVTSIGNGAFVGTGYYNDNSNWTDGVLYIGKYLIQVDTSISGSYKIKDSTTVIAEQAFFYCISLTSITIPDKVVAIGDYMFYYCISLTNVSIGNGVTSIGSCAFYYCTSLESVTIGDGVETIGTYAFYGCTSLTSVYYKGTASEWSAITFGNSSADPTYYGATIYYYAESGSTTEVGNYWYYDNDGNIKTWNIE